MSNPNVEVGDVIQIIETFSREGWVGCFATVTEVKPWGVQAFVAFPREQRKQSQAFIRLKWEHFEKVGTAVLVLAEPTDED